MTNFDFRTIAAMLVLFGGFGIVCYSSIIDKPKKPQEPEYRHFEPIAKPKPPVKPEPIPKPIEPPKKPKKPTASPETIEAMHKQADAERAIAEALEYKAQYITDPVKRARIEKQAALAWTQFNKILDRIDKLTATD